MGRGITIDDFANQKMIHVNVSGGVETCASYCTMPPNEVMRPFGLPNGTADVGATTLDGKRVEHYRFSDKVLKIITMSTTDFYADTSKPAAAVPVFAAEALTPYGQGEIGTRNTTWKAFTPGTPPAAKFKIAGMDTCKRVNCRAPQAQMERLATGRMRSLDDFSVPF